MLGSLFKPRISRLIGARMFSHTKIFDSCESAIHDMKDGVIIACGGFGIWGIPENLIAAIEKKNIRDLTCISNNGGVSDWGLGRLMIKKQIKRMIGASIMENKLYEKQYLEGDLEVEFTPQGNIAEKLRAGGSGIPAFYTPTGVGTFLEHGGFPIKIPKDGSAPTLVTKPRPVMEFNGKKYLLETALTADYSIVKGYKADYKGNVIFNKSARNFNVDAAKAGKICIVEVEEIVPTGTLDPELIQLPHVYVQRLVQCDHYEKRIEFRTTSSGKGDVSSAFSSKALNSSGEKLQKAGIRRKRIAMRAASEMKSGIYNLGIGIPTLITNFIDPKEDIVFQSENGILGMGGFPPESEVDADLINAGKQTIKLNPGGSYFHSSDSFGMIRGRHLDATFLGGFQVSEKGDLANWVVPGKLVKGMGGAMDLVHGAKKIVILMEHVSKEGELRVLKQCKYPLTGEGVVDELITDLAVFTWDKDKNMTLSEIAFDTTVDYVRSVTDADFNVADDLKIFAHNYEN